MNAFEKPWNAEEIKAGLLELLAKFKQSPAEKRFAEVYEDVRDALQEGLPLKHALAYLETYGLKLSPATFKKFAERQAKNGGKALKTKKRMARKPRKPHQRKVTADVPAAPAKKAGDSA